MRRIRWLSERGAWRPWKRPPWLPDAALRLSIVLVVLVAGFVLVRRALPVAMKDRAVQVAAATEREAVRNVTYAGARACGDCHEEQVTVKKDGYHRNLSCETCHGPAAAHVADPMEVKPSAPRDRKFCPKCHAYSLSRPMGFPQINPVTHNPVKPCIACHEPHDPKPPNVPGECRACHGEIARTKELSPHALLECTTCHTTPEAHKVTPHDVMPSKPVTREFCGTCHGTDSKVAGVPKVDVKTHGEKYLCWQCHYPHMPELHGLEVER